VLNSPIALMIEQLYFLEYRVKLLAEFITASIVAILLKNGAQ
jgi:hypothetical protein